MILLQQHHRPELFDPFDHDNIIEETNKTVTQTQAIHPEDYHRILALNASLKAQIQQLQKEKDALNTVLASPSPMNLTGFSFPSASNPLNDNKTPPIPPTSAPSDAELSPFWQSFAEQFATVLAEKLIKHPVILSLLNETQDKKSELNSITQSELPTSTTDSGDTTEPKNNDETKIDTPCNDRSTARPTAQKNIKIDFSPNKSIKTIHSILFIGISQVSETENTINHVIDFMTGLKAMAVGVPAPNLIKTSEDDIFFPLTVEYAENKFFKIAIHLYHPPKRFKQKDLWH